MSSSRTEAAVDVVMPQMGVSVAEGTIAEWKKQAGDAVERDEVICAISTDKIDTDVESPAAGVLAEILVDVGETVPVGTVLARISAGGTVIETETETETEEDHVAPRHVGVGREGDRRYSPVVMRMAAEHGIDLSQVEGTGRNGRVRKQDVLAYLDNGGSGGEEPPMHIESPYRPDEPSAPRSRKLRFGREEPEAATAPATITGDLGPVQAGPLSRMRQSIGKAMVQSLQTAATCTTIVEVDMSAVEALRAQTGLTALPYVARATIETLREFPDLNATLEGDTFTRYENVHLGIAVSLGTGGLIVPVIHNAHELSAEGLASRIRDLARRARENQLTPDDVRGGTFTITNPGGYGSIIATPVINLPQIGILDTEAVVKRAVVIDDAIAIRPMSHFCMSWDHRAIDGAYAAQFLAALRDRVSNAA